ncbi:MAG: S46 family peptidase [Flavobacteriales bacterium]|nr:S46 family peptidase [Flavobacteriales bacterium]
MKVLILLAFVGPTPFTHAYEGMWVPTLLKAIESDMVAAGLRITAEDIYSINNGSIKDAVVLFGGGCTAEVISGEGLILTNHHCGFGAIQRHSSLEHDYLKNGFWARSRAEELRNEGLTATFIVRMEDVTARMLEGLSNGLSEGERRAKAAALGEVIAREAATGTHFKAVVRPFNFGNSYFLIVTETFLDVRLVGAPPGAIGKFGGDTDNWMWPRHTGDFSLFRIYSGSDGKPAPASDTNVPFIPRHVLPISLDGVKEGDFAMIFGFPGTTQRYLTSGAVQYVMTTQAPIRIRMREASLAVIDQAMRASDKTRIQYAAKQSGISNSYKKWIGELRGLKEMNALERKLELEAEYQRRSKDGPYSEVLGSLQKRVQDQAPYAKARDLFNELLSGAELFRFAIRFKTLVSEADTLQAKGKLEEELTRLKKMVKDHFKDYDVEVDRRVMRAQLPIYAAEIDPKLGPDWLKEIDARYKGSTDAFVDALYARSMLTSEKAMLTWLGSFTPRSAKKLAADPAYRAAMDLLASYQNKVQPEQARLAEGIESDMRSFVKGLLILFPERAWWPDANSTLRLSFGKVEGSDPRDGITYKSFTTLDGIMEKFKPEDPEFDVPEGLIALHKARDYGRYGEGDRMPVCFTSSLHTTGGNSGSPVLNGNGELIGLNFDRTWESTMSDIMFDPAKCRNIAVDIRYVLFVVDKLCGAGHLVEEMSLVRRPVQQTP